MDKEETEDDDDDDEEDQKNIRRDSVALEGSILMMSKAQLPVRIL